MTTLAVGFLLLDGVLLIIAAYYLKNWGMAVLGVALFAMAGAVLRYHRRHKKTLQEVEQVKESLRAELAELKRLVNERERKS